MTRAAFLIADLCAFCLAFLCALYLLAGIWNIWPLPFPSTSLPSAFEVTLMFGWPLVLIAGCLLWHRRRLYSPILLACPGLASALTGHFLEAALYLGAMLLIFGPATALALWEVRKIARETGGQAAEDRSPIL